MSYQCPGCGNNLMENAVFSEFRDSNGWYCNRCRKFYSTKKLRGQCPVYKC